MHAGLNHTFFHRVVCDSTQVRFDCLKLQGLPRASSSGSWLRAAADRLVHWFPCALTYLATQLVAPDSRSRSKFLTLPTSHRNRYIPGKKEAVLLGRTFNTLSLATRFQLTDSATAYNPWQMAKGKWQIADGNNNECSQASSSFVAPQIPIPLALSLRPVV